MEGFSHHVTPPFLSPNDMSEAVIRTIVMSLKKGYSCLGGDDSFVKGFDLVSFQVKKRMKEGTREDLQMTVTS